MKNKKTGVGLFLASVAAISVLGTLQTSQADPKESQRLRGLGDRVFFVSVTLTADPLSIGPFLDPRFVLGVPFDNCYVFASNGDWSETGFPTMGTWIQHSTGARTGYTANAGAVIQNGEITPARGKGVLQLAADTSVLGGVLEFHSVGYEVDSVAGCP